MNSTTIIPITPENDLSEQEQHPLDAIPVPVPGVETRSDSYGNLHLRLAIEQRGRFDAFVRKILRYNPSRQLCLDKKGADFWELLDGVRSLRVISGIMAAGSGLEDHAAEESAVLFTKMLMTRRFLLLEIPLSPHASPISPTS